MQPLTGSPRCPAGEKLITAISGAMKPAEGLAVLYDAAERVRCQPGLVRDRLRFLARNEGAAAELACDTYQHQNGFLKVRLLATAEFSVRLHIWPESTRGRGEYNPHGHRWEFASWVLAGDGLVERMYEPCDASTEARAYHLYGYGGSGADQAFDPRGRAWLRETDRIDHARGQVYACSTDVVHTVEPAGGNLVATVVVQGPAVRASTPVYAQFAENPRSREKRITGAQLATHIAAVERMWTTSG